MIRLLTALLLAFSLSWGVLYDAEHEKKELSFLKSLDIDETFITDPIFLQLKSNYLLYRQEMFMQVLSDAYIYIPMIRQMLSDAGLPSSLIYMAMAESAFKNRAYSKKRAVGIWQFMPGTAKIFGLQVDDYIDERRDPIKSTQAAIRYMNHLHGMFGKWYLAALAYNCGEGRLKRAIKQVGSDDLKELLRVRTDRKGRPLRRQPLPSETRKYVRKILSMASVSESDDLMVANGNSHFLNRGASYPMVTVIVGAGTTLKEISDAIEVDHREIKSLNAALRYDFVPPYMKEYPVYIPYDKLASFKENYTPRTDREKYMIHTVKPGDTLGGIGKRYGIPYRVIRDFNKLRSTRIHPGDKLVVPVPRNDTMVYVVQRGDTLYSISKKFGVSVDRLKSRNKLDSSVIGIGDKIVIQR